MDAKARRKSRVNGAIITACLFVIVSLVALFFYQRKQTDGQSDTLHSGSHILMLLPALENQLEDFRAEAKKVADQYDLQIETVSLPTVAAQRQMLSLVPVSDIDAVLLWAVSNMDEDYAAELQACQAANIPVVMIAHDFDDKSLRSSFIGSGMNSERMVINQTLWSVKEDVPILIGCYSHASSGNIYELLVMRKQENPDFNAAQIWNERLKSFVTDRPNDYFADQYIRVQSGSNETASLNMELIRTLQMQEPAGLLFSLDETLTSALTMGLENGALEKERLGTVIGYGGEDELAHYSNRGVIDELLISDVLYSSNIGLRYLHDILRGFWVPPTLDSGVKLVT